MTPELQPDLGTSRRDTTRVKVCYLDQVPLDFGVRLGFRSWVHRALRLRVAERRRDRDLTAAIVRRRHYLARWDVPPQTLILSYLADLDGLGPGQAGAAAMVRVALLPQQYHVTAALGLGQLEVLTLTRSWRADDLGPDVAPDLTPEVLRRVVRGERNRGPLRALRDEWVARKCREGGLRAVPRLLATYADPAAGHDGALYRGAGATCVGPGAGGKLLFAWALDPALREPLRQLGRAVEERHAAPAA